MAEDRESLRLSHQEHLDWFNQVVLPKFPSGLEEQDAPTAILLHGQPGAGKSTYAESVAAEFENRGGVIVVGGGTVRPLHPKFDQLRTGDERALQDLDWAVDQDTRACTAMLVDHAVENRLNVVIDSNLAGHERLRGFVDQLHPPRNDGRAPHSIEVRSVGAPAAVSQLRALDRFYEESARDNGKGAFCMQEIQDRNFAGTLQSAEAVDASADIDRVVLVSWWQDNEIQHEQTFADGRWSPGPEFANELGQARDEQFTPEQQQWFVGTAEKLAIGLGEEFHGASYQNELHRACVDARQLIADNTPARERLETVIAGVDASSTPAARGAIRDALKARRLTETNNAGRPSAAAGTAGEQAAVKFQIGRQDQIRGL